MMEKHLEHLKSKNKKIYGHLMDIYKPEKISMRHLDSVAEFISKEYSSIQSLGVDLFSYDNPWELYNEASLKVKQHRRQQLARRFMPAAYNEGGDMWAGEVAYWLDMILQNEPGEDVVRSLQEGLIAAKEPEHIVSTLKAVINNYLGAGEFPSIQGKSMQKVYQDERRMLVEVAWNSYETRLLADEYWFETHGAFVRSYILYRKESNGVKEAVAFNVIDDEGYPRIHSAINQYGGSDTYHLEQILKQGSFKLWESIRGLSNEDVCCQPELWIDKVDLKPRDIELSEDAYKKVLRKFLEGSESEWGFGVTSELMTVSQNLLFLAQQHRDINGFVSVVMKEEIDSGYHEVWLGRLLRWYLSDNNAPAVSGEVMKRFATAVMERGEGLDGVDVMDLLVLSSRLAPSMAVGELVDHVMNSDGWSCYGERSFLIYNEKREKSMSRPAWVKNQLDKLLDCAHRYSFAYLIEVVLAESRWLGEALHCDERWNQRLLKLSKKAKDGLNWRHEDLEDLYGVCNKGRTDDLFSLNYIRELAPLFKRLMVFPEGAQLLRDWCRSAPTDDWLWNLPRVLNFSEIRVLLSEKMLAPEGLERLIKAVPEKIIRRVKLMSNYRSIDLMLSLVFEQAGGSFSADQESFLSALCGKSGEMRPMPMALGVVVRDEKVRLCEGEGWEERLAIMKSEPHVLKEMLKRDLLSLDCSSKIALTHNEFMDVLVRKCYSEEDMEIGVADCCDVKKSELIDAYIESFGVSAMQSILDKEKEQEKFIQRYHEDAVRHIEDALSVKEDPFSNTPWS